MAKTGKLNKAEAAAIQDWYTDFLRTAKSVGLDLTKKEDMGCVSWFNRRENSGNVRFERVPAFVPTRDDRPEPEPSRFVDNMVPDPQWVFDNIQTEVSLEKKAQLYQMAKEGRLFLSMPNPDDTKLRQVRVDADGWARIIDPETRTLTNANFGTEKMPNPPKFVLAPGKEPVVPPEPAKPTGGQRFANFITAGNAYRKEIEQRQRYEEALQAHEKWQKDSAAYETFRKEQQSYSYFRDKHTRLREMEKLYPDHEKLTGMLDEVQRYQDAYHAVLPVFANQKVFYTPDPAFAGDLETLKGNYQDRAAGKTAARFWQARHEELRGREAAESGKGELTPENDEATFRRLTGNAALDAVYVLNANDEATLNRRLSRQYPQAEGKEDFSPAERQILADGLIAKGILMHNASKAGGADKSMAVMAEHMKAVLRAHIMAEIISVGEPTRSLFQNSKFRDCFEDSLNNAVKDEASYNCGELYQNVLGPASIENLSEFGIGVMTEAFTTMDDPEKTAQAQERVRQAEAKKAAAKNPAYEFVPVPGRPGYVQKVKPVEGSWEKAVSVLAETNALKQRWAPQEGQTGLEPDPEYPGFFRPQETNQPVQSSPRDDVGKRYIDRVSGKIMEVAGDGTYVRELANIPMPAASVRDVRKAMKPGIQFAIQKVEAMDQLRGILTKGKFDSKGALGRSDAAKAEDALYRFCAATLYEMQQNTINDKIYKQEKLNRDIFPAAARTGGVSTIVDALKRSNYMKKVLSSPSKRKLEAFLGDPKVAKHALTECLKEQAEIKKKKAEPAPVKNEKSKGGDFALK